MGSRRSLSLRPLSTLLVGSWAVAAMAVLTLTGCGGGGSSTKNTVPQNSSITVSVTGGGTGMVTSADGDIKCGPGSTSCAASYANGTAVTLNAAPTAGSTFGGFSGGGCSGTATSCVVTLTSGVAITATFNLPVVTDTLTINSTGTGTGTITSADGMINCGAACSASYVAGTQVTLTAVAASGSTFAGWSGACSGSSSQCVVTMAPNTLVTASFTEAVKTNMTWNVGANSSCGYVIYWRLFDRALDWYWPNASTVWVMNYNNTTYTETISCTTGDQILFGASESSSSDTYYWGAGINGTEACASCAYTCESTTINVPTLECN